MRRLFLSFALILSLVSCTKEHLDRQQEQHKQLVLEDLRAAFTNSDLGRDLDPLWGEATVFETDSSYLADVPLLNPTSGFFDLKSSYEPITRLMVHSNGDKISAYVIVLLTNMPDFDYQRDMHRYSGYAFAYNLESKELSMTVYHNLIDITHIFARYNQSSDALSLTVHNIWDPDGENPLGTLPDFIAWPKPTFPGIAPIPHDPVPKDVMEDFWGSGGGGGGSAPNPPPPKPDDKKPCADADKKKANPLADMKILGTLNNGIKGGDFGSGRGFPHHGIDLDGEIGTPIYSMFECTVEKAVNFYDPKLSWEDYKTSYPSTAKIRGENEAGNRVNMRCLVNGESILIKHFHLNNVGINPRTERPFAYGNKIYTGEIIGYLGKTGSASASDSAGAHLHLEIHKKNNEGKSKPSNPKEYLYSEFNLQTGKGSDCN